MIFPNFPRYVIARSLEGFSYFAPKIDSRALKLLVLCLVRSWWVGDELLISTAWTPRKSRYPKGSRTQRKTVTMQLEVREARFQKVWCKVFVKNKMLRVVVGSFLAELPPAFLQQMILVEDSCVSSSLWLDGLGHQKTPHPRNLHKKYEVSVLNLSESSRFFRGFRRVGWASLWELTMEKDNYKKWFLVILHFSEALHRDVGCFVSFLHGLSSPISPW